MALFPILPVLEEAERLWSHEDRAHLPETWFVCCQHLLETTGSLLESFVRMGAQPTQMLVFGKTYSTHARTAERLRSLGIRVRDGRAALSPGRFADAIAEDGAETWREALSAGPLDHQRRVIVLDDGGHCAQSMPPHLTDTARVVVVEQTTSGLTVEQPEARARPPIVAVAGSAAKRVLEAPLIVEATVRRLSSVLPGHRIGVLGLGALGSVLMEHLRAEKVQACAFDTDPAKMHLLLPAERAATAEMLLQRSDLVVGCTGEPCLQPEWLPERDGPLVLASASSGDREFGNVLRRFGDHLESADDGTCPTLIVPAESQRCEVAIRRSGYPVNFDNSSESVPRDQIQLTRGLLSAGVLQASRLGGETTVAASRRLKLDSELQRRLVVAWARCGGRVQEDVLQRFNDLSWIERGSGTRGSLVG